MTRLTMQITMSLDGFVAGPNASLENPLGEGAEHLHDWLVRLAAFQESHGGEGGETGPDDELVRAEVAARGATIMGRRMFSGGSGKWEADPMANGWWGDEPPFHHPVFVLTHHPREPLVLQGGTTFHFVSDGIESALEQARAAAGDKDVSVVGGADVVQQYLRAGLLDELTIHVAPLLLGAGVRLFDDAGGPLPSLELVRVVDSPRATHLTYRSSST